MKAIWKFPFHISDTVIIEMPKGARILPYVAYAGNGMMVVWAEVNADKDAPKEDKILYVVGTGHPMPESLLAYIGTVITNEALVWHCYERLDGGEL